MEDAHPPSEEDEEGHHELQEVVAEGLEAVDPPWGVVQEVGHGVGHRLRLWDRRPVSYTRRCTPQDPACLHCSGCWEVSGESPEQQWALESPMRRTGYRGEGQNCGSLSQANTHMRFGSCLKGNEGWGTGSRPRVCVPGNTHVESGWAQCNPGGLHVDSAVVRPPQGRPDSSVPLTTSPVLAHSHL